MRVEIELRMVPRFRVIDDLVTLGGTATEALEVTGAGWIARIEALEPDDYGRVAIARDRLVIEGDDHAVERVATFMQGRIRTLRRAAARYHTP